MIYNSYNDDKEVHRVLIIFGIFLFKHPAV